MSYKSMFIYKVTTQGAIYVIVAHHRSDIDAYHFKALEKVEKLGCVTADVCSTIEPGVINRQWRHTT